MTAHQTRSTSYLRLLLLLGAVAVLGSGCTAYTSCRSWLSRGMKVGPDFCRPAAPLESTWIDSPTDSRVVSETVDLANWWRLLEDPVLDTLVESAYDQNLTVRQAGTRIQQAAAIRAIAVGNLFPQVQEGVGDYQRVQASRNVAVPSPIQHFSQFDLGMQAGWELDFWGRFRRSVDAADANLDASIASYDDVTVLLLSAVAATYVEIRTIQERLQIVNNILELQRGSLAIADARYRSNQTNKLDVIQAQNNIDVTAASIPQLESQLRVANNRLCVLLGMPPVDLIAELPPAPIPSVSRYVQVGIPADLLRRRPDIRRAEQLMRAQSEKIGIAEADLYPRISLVGSFEWQAEDVRDLFDASSVFALISPGFSWNLLNYGRLQNAITLEEERFRESVYGYQQTVLEAQQEVEDAIVSFLKAQDRADQLADAVAQVNEADAIAETLYETGAIDFNRVYLIQAFQFAQQDDLVVSRAEVVLNLISIYKALGGGWEIRCPNRRGVFPLGYQGDKPHDANPIGEIEKLEFDERPVPPVDSAEEVPSPAPQPKPDNPRLEELLNEEPSDENPPQPESNDGREERLQELLDEGNSPPEVTNQEGTDQEDIDTKLDRLLQELPESNDN